MLSNEDEDVFDSFSKKLKYFIDLKQCISAEDLNNIPTNDTIVK